MYIIPQVIQDEIVATIKSKHNTLWIPKDVMSSLKGFKWESVIDELAASAPLLTAVITGKDINKSDTFVYIYFDICLIFR